MHCRSATRAVGQRRYPPADHDLANGWHFQAAYNRSSNARGGYDLAAYYGAPDRDGIGVHINPSYSHADATQDREAVSLPKRAQPLPKTQPEKAGATLTLVVPVEFLSLISSRLHAWVSPSAARKIQNSLPHDNDR